MNFPNLKNYYYAARLDQIKAWFDPHSDKLWAQTEKSVVGNRHMPTLLLSSLTHLKLICKAFPSVDATIVACTDFPIQIYEYIIPNVNSQLWAKEGILTYKELLCKQPRPISFSYIQLTYFHNNNPNISYKIHREFWSYLMSSHDKPKGMSWFYSKLQYSGSFQNSSNMKNWEKEMDTSFTQREWQNAIQSHFCYSHCVNHWELMLKMLYGTYLTPVRLVQIYPGSSPNCWRECGEKGGIPHILWKCKRVKSFWKTVFSLITTVTGLIISPSPQMAILNIGIHTIPTQFRPIVTHVLLAAITSRWKSLDAPNLSEVVYRVKLQYLYEKYFAIQTQNLPKFKSHWDSWIANYPSDD